MKNQKIFVLISILFLASCQTIKIEEQIVSASDLHHELPDRFDLDFIDGSKEIKPGRYYSEISSWKSKSRMLFVRIYYDYLLDNYVFAGERPPVEEVVKSKFEGEIVSLGTSEISEDRRYAFVNFSLKNADCLYFRKFIAIGAPPDMIDGDPHETYLGQVRLAGLFCDYGNTQITTASINEFVSDIKIKEVNISKQLKSHVVKRNSKQ